MRMLAKHFLFKIFVLWNYEVYGLGHPILRYILWQQHTSLKLICPSLSSSTSLIILLRPKWVCGSPSFSIINLSSIKSINPLLSTSYLMYEDFGWSVHILTIQNLLDKYFTIFLDFNNRELLEFCIHGLRDLGWFHIAFVDLLLSTQFFR